MLGFQGFTAMGLKLRVQGLGMGDSGAQGLGVIVNGALNPKPLNPKP